MALQIPIERRHGLVLLNIASSCFGWVWIIAWLATFYFLYVAVADAGPRLYVLWAALAAVGTKTVADFLRDSYQQLNYIDQLVQHGYSLRDAEAAWLTSHEGGYNALLNLQQAETLSGAERMEFRQGGRGR